MSPHHPDEEPDEQPGGPLSDERVRERTGMGWEQWFHLLDGSLSPAATRREVARWVADYLDLAPLAHDAQAIARSYEAARRGGPSGQHEGRFTATASRTVDVPPAQVYAALEGWLSGAPLAVRSTSPPGSARYEWTGDRSRVSITLAAKDGGTRCLVAVSHARLPDAAACETRKTWWRERLLALKATLEGSAW